MSPVFRRGGARSEQIGRHVLAVLVIAGIGSLVGYLSGSGADDAWYRGLEKSALNPPGWAFATVWPILYALMAVSAVMVWGAAADPRRALALTVFAVQLALNYSWSFVFFTAQAPAAALVLIGAILGLALWTFVLFRNIRPVAGLLLLPYIAWLAFAFWLNLAIVRLN